MVTSVTAGAQTACDPITNEYTQEVTVTYLNDPGSGMLDVNGQQFAITSSPQTVTLTGLNSNGMDVDVVASLTAAATCTFSVPALFTAPDSCPPCEVTMLAAGTQTACDPITNEYTQEITVTYANEPTSGMLDVNGQQFAITGGPQTVTLTGLNSNGMDVDVTAFFTDDAGCTMTTAALYTAPDSCPPCAITMLAAGTQTTCDSATNSYTQEVTVTYENDPASGTLDVNGQSFTITGSPQTVTLVGLVADGNSVDVTASFSDDAGCTMTSTGLFTAPADCSFPCRFLSVAAGAQSACDPGTNTYTQDIIVEYDHEPGTGTLDVNGQSFAVTGSPQTVTLTGLPAIGVPVTVTASFSDDVDCDWIETDLFTGAYGCAPTTNCGLIFSEYIEGTSLNKCLEIYNGTSSTVDLAADGYAINIYFNGSASPTTINLTGTVVSGEVFVICNQGATIAFLLQSDQTSGSMSFNGNDAIELVNSGGTVDIIGQIGTNPGSQWSGSGCGTADQTLVRMASVISGDVNGADAFDPSMEWICNATNSSAFIGSHTSDNCPSCVITGLSAGAQGACVPATNEYTQDITITYENEPAMGLLDVNGQTFPITGSPQTVTLTGLDSDGMPVDVSVFFTADPNCMMDSTGMFTAPANCEPCSIMSLTAGAQSACDPGTNIYTQEITVEYNQPPASGFLEVNGFSFPINSSPQMVTLTGLLSTGMDVDVTATFTADPACTLTELALYTAPDTCSPCAITMIAAGTQTACDVGNNEYTQELTITYENAPATGMLDVNGQTFAITGSPQVVVLTGLDSDGMDVDVTASFTDEATCSLTENALFTAPATCIPCTINSITAGTQSACDPGTNEYTQEITVMYQSAPSTGMMDVNGQTFAITTSPQTVTLTGLFSDGMDVDVTVSFTDDAGCMLTELAAFTAPATCSPCLITSVTAGTQTGCVFSNNEYTQEIIVEYASPPAAGMLDVNGQQFAITGSPQSVVLTGLNSDGMDVDVTVFFTDSVACTATMPALYTAPDSCPLNGSFVINEVDAATPGFDQGEFIEIIGPPNAPLDGLVIVLFNGNNDLSYAAFDLDGFTLDANGFFVLGNAGVPNVDMIISDNTIQNGADGVGLYFGDAIDFPNNTPATATNLIDALVYDSGQPDDASLLGILTPGQPQINEGGNGMLDSHSSSRVPDGGTPLNTSTYVAQQPTPGETNIPCSITDIAAGAQTPCDPGTSVYTQTLTITYIAAPSSGTLDVNGQSFPITSSPQDVILTGLPADGMPVDVTASFSDNAACTLTENAVFTAPTCTCDISAIAVGPQTACDDGGGTYDIEVTVTYEYSPSTGTLDVNGQSFAIGSSPQTVVLTGMPLDGQSVDLTASFSDDGACTFTETGAYTAPSVCGCIITNLAAGAQTSCDPLTNEYTQEVIVTYSDAPTTGTLVVNGQFFAIGSSPQTVVLTGLDSDGLDVDVSANFSDDPTCSASETALFTAPAACPCAIDNVTAGAQSACDGGTNEYTQDITVEYTNGPTTGTLDVNGQSFAVSGSPQTITLVGLIADGMDVDVSVSFSDNGACSSTSTALFTAPISCATPANDICENAIPVACGGSAPGNTTAATLDNNAAAVSCGFPFAISVTAPGVWYEVVGTGGNVILGVCDADYDTKMSIFEGRCDSLVCTGAIDDGCNSFRSQFNLASELNKTYYVLVHGFGSATGTFNFTVDCDPVCIIDSMTAESGTCVGSTYSQDVTIYYSLPPTTGNLSVNGQLFSILGSPQTVTLTGTVDGNPVDVDAFFTVQPTCTLSEPALFTPCTCPNITTIPTVPGVYTADLECTDAMGWTHYYDTGNNLLLLSIEKNGENIGSVGDVGFDVEVEVLAGYASGTGIDLSTAPYVTNPDGWFVMNRYWDVTPVNQPSNSVFIRTYYTDDDFTDVQGSVSNAGGSISTHPELTFYKIGTNFDPSPATGHSAVGPADYAEPAWTYSAFNSVDHYAEYAVSSFSGGGGGSGGGGSGTGALSVELLSFTGQQQGDHVGLNWITSQEVNSDYFQVQRSIDGVSFISLGEVNAAGNSLSPLSYDFVDTNPVEGVNYYRLKAVDLDGSFEYSNILSFVFRPGEAFSLYPNPFADELFVRINGIDRGTINFELYNANGQRIRQEAWEAIGSDLKQVEVSDLAEGVYFYKIWNGGSVKTGEIIRMK